MARYSVSKVASKKSEKYSIASRNSDKISTDFIFKDNLATICAWQKNCTYQVHTNISEIMSDEIKEVLHEEEILNEVNDAEQETEETPENEENMFGIKSKADKHKEEIEQLTADVAEAKDKYLRLFAEFDNFKKRSIKERLDLMNSAAKDTVTSLLPVIDDFDRAKKYADDDSSEEPFSEGVTAVYNKLHSILKSKGLVAMESTGEVFDVELHNAITEILRRQRR